jgi:hypothetical protein
MASPGEATGGRIGCLPIVACLTAIAAGISLSTCVWLRREDAVGRLPPQIGFERIVAAHSEGVIMEGCVYATYLLTPTTVRLLRERGIDALIGTYPEKNYANNPDGDWQRTPLPSPGQREAIYEEGGEPQPLFALGAASGCGDARGAKALEIERLLRQPGNFYNVTRNGEGLILISPSEGMAAFLYFG